MDSVISSIKFFNLTVRDAFLLEDARELAAVIFSDWNKADLKLTQCTEGITNKRSVIFDNVLLLNTICLSEMGLAQKVYGRYKNGLVYGYSEGRTFDSCFMGKEPLKNLVPKYLAKWHKADIPGDKTPSLFFTLRKWLAQLPETYADKEKNEFYLANFDKKRIGEEIEFVEGIVNRINPPVLFCHNDLLSGNILLNEAKGQITFIDFEYGSYNYRGYDIANHFCEFAGFECEYSRYPTEEEQKEWLRIYLGEFYGVGAEKVEEAELDKVIFEVDVFSLASSLYWGLWSLLQAFLSDLEFDYMSYGKLRFERYFSEKKRIEHGP
ncbi:hypothetical protein BB558_004275 [Smittium angustum]|uniref:ethanolamine kinase n=1 Tax=Smittium angustum TaxID=133377 RepID=A0A2U1J3P1_SMIAN|nr:hypothetical protein BB558_004275 [Smittium angustum]